MPDTNWPADIARMESEQSGELACDVCGKAAPLVRVVAYGIETMACAEYRGEPAPLMDQIVAICRDGHERAMRQNGCPLAIRLWADQPASYSTWRERTRDRADCERDRGPGKW